MNILSLVKSYSNRLTFGRVHRKISSISERFYIITLNKITSNKPFECTACGGKIVGFYNFGPHTKMCPICKSTDRERHLVYLLQNRLLNSVQNNPVILQIAPSELSISRVLATMGVLIKGDYEPSRYDAETIKIDLTQLDQAPYFDIIVLSHVLEHLPDDSKILKNLNVKLPVGGEAWIQVPIIYEKTMDGWSSMTLKDRERLFGGSDHLRAYGMDLVERLESAGFQVSLHKSSDLSIDLVEKFGFGDDVVFVAKRT